MAPESVVTPGHRLASTERQNQGASRIPAHVRSTHSNGGAVILDILHGQMFRLNGVGSRILELLQAGSPEPEIAEWLTHEFGIDRALADADLREFLADLKRHQLLHAR